MAQLTIQQAFDLALQHQQAGRNDIALDLIRQVITLKPDYAEAHNSLGILLAAKGELNEAIAAFRQAIVLKPDYASAHSNLGNALRESGRLDESIAACRVAVAVKPDFAAAHDNLGVALKEKGLVDDAIGAFRRAIARRPNYAEAHYNLGNAWLDKRQFDDAIAAYRRAIALRPNYVEAFGNLGIALADIGQFDEAIAAYRQAIVLRPNYAEAHSNLGAALKDKGQFDDAIVACRRAISIRPNYAEAYGNLGNALLGNGQIEEAIAAHRQAIAIHPRFAEAYSNLGFALREKGEFDAAVAVCREAISLNPDLPGAHNNLSLTLLLKEDFKQGWEEYEWRLKCRDFRFPPRNFPQPRWDGGPLENRTLLIHTEQGFGDAFQFIRYLPLVAERGGRIIVECYAELERLLRPMAGRFEIVVRGQPLPAFDVQLPLLSLPGVFQTTLATIPQTVPYLHAEAEKIGKWQRRLGDSASMVKVGLVWAGSPAHPNDRNRSIELARLAPLAQTSGVRFFSLQKEGAAIQAKSAPAGMEPVDWTDELKDFADTAALIANLDLIIAVDTSLAHLAGAMGKPVWMLLPFVPDWRWLLEREDSPWYPSMRLFRQPCRGDWESVIRRMAEELPVWMKNRL